MKEKIIVIVKSAAIIVMIFLAFIGLINVLGDMTTPKIINTSGSYAKDTPFEPSEKSAAPSGGSARHDTSSGGGNLPEADEVARRECMNRFKQDPVLLAEFLLARNKLDEVVDLGSTHKHDAVIEIAVVNFMEEKATYEQACEIAEATLFEEDEGPVVKVDAGSKSD